MKNLVVFDPMGVVKGENGRKWTRKGRKRMLFRALWVEIPKDSVCIFQFLISLLIIMVELFVGILWAVFIFIILLLVVRSVKVVHQGTFMIVEHFGEYSVWFCSILWVNV